MVNKNILLYSIVAAFFFVADRISKYWMIHYCSSPIQVNQFLSCSLSYNKGISWSLLSTDNQFFFMSTTIALVIFMVFFSWSMRIRGMRGQFILGELLIVSGGISNIIDRFVYRGVPDFIVFSYGSWSWPSFNVADMAIVLGCLIMFFTLQDK